MVRRKISRKAHPAVRFGLWLTFLALVTGIILLIKLYGFIFFPTVNPEGTGISYFYIHTGAEFQEVITDLEKLPQLLPQLARAKNVIDDEVFDVTV